MSHHQRTHYHTHDFAPLQQRIINELLTRPGQTIAEIADRTGLDKSTVSGRVSELKARGCLICVDAPGGQQLTYDTCEYNHAHRAKAYARASHPVCKFHDKFLDYMTPSLYAELRKLYLRVEAGQKTNV